VRWFKDEPKQRLHQNDKYDMTNDYHDKHNRSVLVIRNVQRIDLVDYHCEVEVIQTGLTFKVGKSITRFFL
jgi:hypothetical protein